MLMIPLNFWDSSKLILGKNNSDNSKIRVNDPDMGLLSTYEQTPDVINKFFTEIGPNLAKKIVPVQDPGTLIGTGSESGSMEYIEPSKILELLDDFNENKCSGCFDLNTKTYLLFF